MSAPQPAPVRITYGRRVAWTLGAVVLAVLAYPLLDDLAHGRSLPLGDWVGEAAFFIIALSVAIGLISAVRHNDGFETAALDRARRRTLWVGVVLLPVAWLLLAVSR